MRSHEIGRVLDLGHVDICKLIIHLVWFGRSGVWERNIMTAIIVTEIHHVMCWMGHVRLARMMLRFVDVLRLPDSLVMIREHSHWFELRFKGKDLFLLLGGFATAVGANAKVLLNLRMDYWELRRFLRLFVSCIVVAME